MPQIEPSPLFREALLSKRRDMSERQREKPIKLPAKWVYPLNLEKQYTTYLRSLMAPFRQYAMPIVRQNISEWIQNGITDDYWLMIDTLREMQEELLSERSLEDITREISFLYDDIDTFNRKQWNKFQRAMIDTAINPDEWAWSGPLKDTWVSTQIEIIRKMIDDFINMLSTEITSSIMTNKTKDQVMNGEEGRNGINQKIRNLTVYKPQFNSRNQVGILNGTFTKNRQLQAGIMEYRWFTEMDERVRGNPAGPFAKAKFSHWKLHRKICKWTNDNVWSMDGKKFTKRPKDVFKGIPGQDYQCRCEGMPYTDNMIKSVDAQIKREERAAN